MNNAHKCPSCDWFTEAAGQVLCDHCTAKKPVRRIGVVGSRAWPDLWMVSAYVFSLPPGTVIVSGGAQGVDSTAEAAAREADLEVEIHRPMWYRADGSFDRGAGFRRNKTIVDRSTEVYAFLYRNSKGTMNSIEWAQRLGKPVTVVSMNEDEYPTISTEGQEWPVTSTNFSIPPK